jgi:hypothetical protein
VTQPIVHQKAWIRGLMHMRNRDTSTMKCLALLFTCLSVSLTASGISHAGEQLAARYDAMDVEHHWLPGLRVDWLTGESEQGKSGTTHCSLFVAATCEKLGIPILHPPKHGAKNLANAQWHWLAGEGHELG